MQDVEISFDPARIDFERTSSLIRQSYWGGQRTDAMDRRAFANSVCAIALIGGEQVGFARASGDRTCFARISDIMVWPGFRGRGIGKMLVEALLGHEELSTVTVWTLNTGDAHRLYERYGFKPCVDGHEMRLDRPASE